MSSAGFPLFRLAYGYCCLFLLTHSSFPIPATPPSVALKIATPLDSQLPLHAKPRESAPTAFAEDEGIQKTAMISTHTKGDNLNTIETAKKRTLPPSPNVL
jgi:hypothetical protein